MTRARLTRTTLVVCALLFEGCAARLAHRGQSPRQEPEIASEPVEDNRRPRTWPNAEPTERWYGWQTLVSDTAAIGLTFLSIAAGSPIPAIMGGVVLLFSPPSSTPWRGILREPGARSRCA